MKILKFLKHVGRLLQNTFVEFLDDNGMKYSAALAYYTVFSLAPMLLIIMSLSGLFFGREAIQGELYSQINKLVGDEAALQIQTTIKNIHLSNDNRITSLIGLVLLFVGATGIFGEI